MRFFNTAGPINPQKHYFVPNRSNEAEIRSLIEQEKYFVLHAPRQTGKTSGILSLAETINQEGQYKALYVNVESAQAMRSKVREAMLVIITNLKRAYGEAFGENDSAYQALKPEYTLDMMTGDDLAEMLGILSSHSDKPIILFIDEIDSLVGDSLIAVLRQLRAG